MKKVRTVQCHVGAGITGRLNFNKFDPQGKEQDGEMELWDAGVFIKKLNLLVPFNNMRSCTMEPETEEEKRGPGRPPKVVA